MTILTICYATPITISLEEPISADLAQTYDQQSVIVRGFLYQHDAGHLILSHLPNLKSCCVGSNTLTKQQLVIKESIPLSLTAVNLTGTFYIDSQMTEKGEILSHHSLKNVEFLPSSQIDWNLFWIVLCAIICCVIFRKWKS